MRWPLLLLVVLSACVFKPRLDEIPCTSDDACPPSAFCSAAVDGFCDGDSPLGDDDVGDDDVGDDDAGDDDAGDDDAGDDDAGDDDLGDDDAGDDDAGDDDAGDDDLGDDDAGDDDAGDDDLGDHDLGDDDAGDDDAGDDDAGDDDLGDDDAGDDDLGDDDAGDDDTAPTVQPGDIIITEVLYDPQGTDGVKEWFEVTNTTGAVINLDGWVLSDDGGEVHTVVGSLPVGPGGFALLAASANTALNGGITPDYVFADLILANTSDELILTAGAVEVDRVAWDDGLTFPDVPGRSISLDPASFSGTANDAGANWCSGRSLFSTGPDLGTPGAANPSCLTCSDSVDNDGDGWIDGWDPDCSGGGVGYEAGFGSGPCNDGADNDGDGLIDNDDPQCDYAADPYERSNCNNGADDDGDGWVDIIDPGCTSLSDDDETGGSGTECGDGLDNDGDGLFDGLDPDCTGPYDTAEGAPAPVCLADGLEPNNTDSNATDISIGTSLTALTACGDPDVFRLVLTSPGSSEISFTWAPTDGSLVVTWDGPIGGCAELANPGEIVLECTGIPFLGDTFFLDVDLGADPNSTVSPDVAYTVDVQ